MTVDPNRAAGSYEYKGKTYYFCSTHCVHRFREDPEKFLQKSVSPVQIARQQVPDRIKARSKIHLPDASGDRSGRTRKLSDLRHGARTRYGFTRRRREPRTRRHESTVLGVLVVDDSGVCARDERSDSWTTVATPRRPIDIELGATTARYSGCAVGRLAFLRARVAVDRQSQSQYVHVDRARRRGGVMCSAVIAVIAPQLFPPSFRGHGGAVPVYFEAAAVITTLVLLGQVLELRARSQTGNAIRALLGLAPKTARRINADGHEEDVPLDHIHVGDRLRVRPGEKVPVDGVILRARARSTSRWSQANRFRWRKGQAIVSLAAR